ncbi:hypothetical protein SELMODRAFT_414783 [Selaginella moellendorffii]|uniref:Pentacotripeptide-repeat region of PRORP domain-containing protein n=1 Tax=Selaginella moellendorffii TaxID=88036 RepID=D8RUL4_SELML|nr:hypothetical protein SELMODRAFT_414783 [Selaginella moellendorffii]
MPEHDIPSTTLFLAAYAQRGGVDVAKDVFDAKLPHHDLFSATALVAVYARNGLFLEAETTFNTMLSRNLVSLNVMLEALVQNRDLAFAKEFFNCRMPEHDLVSLTTLAVALADNNHQHEALKLFHHQHHDSFSTTVLLTSLRQAGFSSKATKNSERSLEQDSPIVQNSAFQAKSGESIGDALDTFWSMCVNGLDSNEPQSSLLGIIGRSYSFEPKLSRGLCF